MTEKLVVEKSRRQRRCEGVLLIVLPPAIGAALWARHGAIPLNTLIIVAAFLLVSPLGGLIASFGPGERIAPDERMRRTLARLVAMPFALVAGWCWLTYTSLFLSALFAGSAPDQAPEMVALVPALLVITLGCALLVTFQLRRWYRRYDPARPAERYASVGQWLKEFLPIQIVCVGSGLAAGFVAAHLVPQGNAGLILGAGWLVGIALEMVVADSMLHKKPLLWTQVGFGGALVIAMARMGLMFAVFTVLYGLLQPIGPVNEPVDKWFVAFFIVAIAIGGFVMGTVLMLILWALARLGDLLGRKTKAGN